MSTDQLSVTFAALADPTRRAILAHLAKGEASVTKASRDERCRKSQLNIKMGTCPY